MPIIRVEMFAGRTHEQKSALVRELTAAFTRSAGGKPETVQVVLVDVEKENWAAGGELYGKPTPD